MLLREGMARLLGEFGFEVVGQSGTAEDLMLKVRSYAPDVAIVDIRMPPTQTDEGLRAAREIRTRYPNVGVLVLSQHVEPEYALELLAESAEGVGYLLKDRSPTSRSSRRRYVASPMAGRRWIRRWSPSSSTDRGGGARWTT